MLVGQIIAKKYIDPINSRIKKHTNTFGAMCNKKRKEEEIYKSNSFKLPQKP